MRSYKDHELDKLNDTPQYSSVIGVTRAARKHNIFQDIKHIFPSGDMPYMLLLA
jgi:hypothetical protein